MKRTFETVTVAPAAEGGFAIALDGQPIMTPARRALAVPSAALAEAIAAEWRGQGAAVVPASMPLTRLANVALDRAAAMREALLADLAAHARADLVCHRAAYPEALAARQRAAWDPLVGWARDALGAGLIVGEGVIALDQPAAAIAAITRAGQGLAPFALTGLAHGVGLAGSAVIGLALQRGRLDADGAFRAAALDDLWQLERWGEDAEARARLDRLLADFTALARWFAAL